MAQFAILRTFAMTLAVGLGLVACAGAPVQEMSNARQAIQAAREAGAEVLLVLNASPYHMNKQLSRYEVIRDRVA